MSRIIDEMRDYYNRRAPVYDASMNYEDEQAKERLAPVANLLRRLMQNRNALEIACGPGYWTKNVCESAASIKATDYNSSMLDQARRKPLDWQKVTLLQADAYDLGAVVGQFNAAYAVDWFAHVPRSLIQAFLGGLHAKLTPGAVVAFCDQLPGAHSLTGVFDAEDNHLQERTLADGSRYRVIKNYFTDEEYAAMFSAHTSRIDLQKFPECRRIIVSYVINLCE